MKACGARGRPMRWEARDPRPFPPDAVEARDPRPFPRSLAHGSPSDRGHRSARWADRSVQARDGRAQGLGRSRGLTRGMAGSGEVTDASISLEPRKGSGLSYLRFTW
jgi:hypothetical protein